MALQKSRIITSSFLMSPGINFGFNILRSCSTKTRANVLTSKVSTPVSKKISSSVSNVRYGVKLRRTYFTIHKPISFTLTTQSIREYSTTDDNNELGRVKASMAIIFTCKVCNTRQTKTFSKHAYEKGIVIVECEGCHNRHLIADNLGWFNHIEERNIEEIMATKGEIVKKGITDGSLDLPEGLLNNDE